MAGEKLYQTITGRLVRGHPFVGNDKNMEGQPRTSRDGKPLTGFFVTVAVRKDDVTAQPFWQAHMAVGQRDFPAGQSQQPGFKGKIQDGDAPHQNKVGAMVPWPEWAVGCYLVNMEQINQPIAVVDGTNQPIIDQNQIKTGDYVMVSVGIRGNDNQGVNAGLYLDPSIMKLVGYGELISTRPDAATVFGDAPAPLPYGASAVPIGNPATMPVAMGGQQAPPLQQPQFGGAGPAITGQPMPGQQPVQPLQQQPMAAPPQQPGAQLGNPSSVPAISPTAPVGIPPQGAAPLQGGATASPSSPGQTAPNPAFLHPA